MGTSYHIKFHPLPAGLQLRQLQAEIDQRLETVNDQMSTWRPQSELSRFNQSPAGDWFPVSSDTAQVVAAAIETSRATDGAFDVTAGPLVNLWHFGPDTTSLDLPTDEAIDAARQLVGYEKIAVRHDPPALKKQLDDIYLDLSAIAKGYGVDVIAEYLESQSITNYLVEIGGEVRASGVRPDGKVWMVAIESPVVEVRRLHTALPLKNQALATSGGYRNYYEIDGQRYSHTIDPRTGRPIAHQLASASVIAPTAMEADAWATAFMVLGPDEGYNIAEELGLAVLLIESENGQLRERATPAFQKLLQSN